MPASLAQLDLLWKVAICGLPLCLALYVAEEIAFRCGARVLSGIWRTLARVVLGLIGVSILARLLLFIM